MKDRATNNPEFRDKLIAGLRGWLEASRRAPGHRVFPVTLEFTPGPWLYTQTADPTQVEMRATQEISVWVERLYRFATKDRDRRMPESGWAFLGWLDRGGQSGFLHAHGFLVVSTTGYWAGESETFIPWIESFIARTYLADGVKSCHFSPEILSEDMTERFGSYARRHEIGDCIWYKAGQTVEPVTKPGLTWLAPKMGRRGVKIWATACNRFHITQAPNKGAAVRVFYAGEFERSCTDLAAGKSWCASQRSKKPIPTPPRDTGIQRAEPIYAFEKKERTLTPVPEDAGYRWTGGEEV